MDDFQVKIRNLDGLDHLVDRLMHIPSIHFQAIAPDLIREYIAQGFSHIVLQENMQDAELEISEKLFKWITRRTK